MGLLKNKGIRFTDFRAKVLQVFTDNKNAITLGQIEESIGKHDRITLYRTLKTFTDNGLIHEIVMPGDIKKMALCAEQCGHDDHTHNHQHIHFLCTNCEEVYCIDYQLPQVSIKGFTFSSLEIQGKGVCEGCGV